jgi:hypothetical protein
MGKTRPVDPCVVQFFAEPLQPLHRQYLALRSFYLEDKSAEVVALQYGYSTQAVYAMAKSFKSKLNSSKCSGADIFFRDLRLGRPRQERDPELEDVIVCYRKKMLSVPDIKIILDGRGYNVTEGFIYRVCDESGFARLPKRSNEQRQELMRSSGYTEVLEALASIKHSFSEAETFSSQGVGVLCFLPFIKAYEIDKAIEKSSYPQTKQIGRLNSILAFLALKLSNVQRYGQDNGWCMDRGLGMFAGLNVLPKATWYSAYSDAIERKDNIAFLKSLNMIFASHGFLSDSANLDFTAIPYWGDESPLENNWSGKRSKALISIQAALAQDPDTGILCYGDTTVKHDNQDDVILQFMDFYHKGTGKNISYLVFDSKFTTLENLGRINRQEIIFVTIQRKSKNLNGKVAQMPDSHWRSVKIEKANHKSRTVVFCESTTTNKRYGEQQMRQIFVKGKAIKPATILTNDFKHKAEDVIRRYSRRWLVENEISEQIHFFHLNRNSSGIVVKVDFDLTMTILAHNLYRLLATALPGYSHYRSQSLYDTFINNYGEVEVGNDTITVKLNRKRALPLLRESIPTFEGVYSWLGNKRLSFIANTHT